ncbi:MAG: hypothetical protein ACFFD8_03230 [Candidatus Thorarchaeota archaeon]
MEEKMIKVLQCLDRASSGCQLGYITHHTNITEPLPLLESLEEIEFVQRCPCDGWSTAGHPKFEITTKGRQQLRSFEVSNVHIPISILRKAFVSH